MGKAKLIIDDDRVNDYYHYTIYVNDERYISGWIRNYDYYMLHNYQYMDRDGIMQTYKDVRAHVMKNTEMYFHIQKMYYWLNF